MADSFVIIKRINAQAANALSSYLFVNGPNVTAAVSYGHALGLKNDFAEDIKGVALIHHHSEFQGDTQGFKVFPYQRRGSGLIDTADYVGASMSMSLQPTSSRHLIVSLIIRVSEDAALSKDKITKFVHSSRFAGGQVLDFAGVTVVEGVSELKQHCPDGFAVMDRKSLVSTIDGDPTSAIMSLLSNRSDYYLEKSLHLLGQLNLALKAENSVVLGGLHDLSHFKQRFTLNGLAVIRGVYRKLKDKHERHVVEIKEFLDDHAWLSATTVGYSAISEFEHRPNSRNNKLHAFVEPLVGLVSYNSVRSIDVLTSIFWSEKWLDDTTYIVSNS
jgi:hypothetical protein